jgi:hypothetical protein
MKEFQLPKLSKAVFPLPPEDLLIIKFLAVNGPSNLKDIVSFVRKKFPRLGWEGIQNKIIGTVRNPSLLLSDYIFEIKEKRSRYGKPAYTYFLLPKGIMASIQSVPLKKNYFFNKYIEFVVNIINGKKLTVFIRNYIPSQMRLFLAYHHIQGIQLTWQSDSSLYFSQFMRGLSSGLTVQSKQKKKIEEFRVVVEEFVILHTVYTFLTKEFSSKHVGNYFPSILHDGWAKSKSNDDLWRGYVSKWMIGFDQVIMEEKEIEIKKITR